jgi:PTH1 family peptidyl-tRNA hydrolase
MWLVVGLGNPGLKYEKTRHNIGFMVIDRMAGAASFRSEHKALVARIQLGGEQVLLAKPQTFMNLSGQSVVMLSQFYKIALDHIVAVHDEIDIPFGHLRVQKNRGPGGHNGIKSMSELMGSQDYNRIKVGVGRPISQIPVADWLLSNFSQEEIEKLPDLLRLSAAATETLIQKGYGPAASQFNQKPADPNAGETEKKETE